MTKITNILEKGDRVAIYIEEDYCTSIRKRTWQAMKLSIGSNISCKNLKDQENFFWKKMYGKDSWEREKIRISRVILWFKKYIPESEISVIGFGAEHTDEILSHPSESGKPDLLITDKDTKIEILMLEVTGTETMRGEGYWIRPDKLEYAQKHIDKDVWIALHYKNPKEKIIWIKPEKDTLSKKIEDINIRGAIEKYIVFRDSDKEIKTSHEFKEYISKKLKNPFAK
jgi:hypothetical protein